MSPAYRAPRYVNQVQELADSIINEIFQFERDRIQRNLQELIVSNHSQGGSRNAFIYQDKMYHLVARSFLKGETIKPVVVNLEGSMESLISLIDKLEVDHRFITNVFSTITPHCKTPQDIRDSFPELLISAIPSLRALPRSREEGFILRKNPKLMPQFMKAMDLIADYQANRLIY